MTILCDGGFRGDRVAFSPSCLRCLRWFVVNTFWTRFADALACHGVIVRFSCHTPYPPRVAGHERPPVTDEPVNHEIGTSRRHRVVAPETGADYRVSSPP
jgi:hypothetical protein